MTRYPTFCRHLHHLLDLPLDAPGLVKMKMETAWVDWAAGRDPAGASAASQGLGSAALPAAAEPSEMRAVLGAPPALPCPVC